MSVPMEEYDRRAVVVRHLNLHYPAPSCESLAAWRERGRDLREHVLACCGLLPMPERTPLNARIFGRVEGDDYTIEKVALETLPGFYLGGNLYRPKGKEGPFPAIANPHGHSTEGRLSHRETGSTPLRCVAFARMGCVAFAYDMIGYNDTDPVSHREYDDALNALWGISVGGLQLWNSIRVLDFLESLPDVDPRRLACTGASGGGTQTYFLSAVDERVAVAAPVCMLSLQMQGGCTCENPPNLRVDATNVDIGALTAPRPLILVAATGDWTKDTLEEEYPALRQVYRLMGAEERVSAVRYEAPHNYNAASRAAVYAWFGRWLLGTEDPELRRERPADLGDIQALRVFAGDERPPDRLDGPGLTRSLIARSEAQLEAHWPTTPESLGRFRSVYGPALRHSLGAAPPPASQGVARSVDAGPAAPAGVDVERLLLEREGRGDRVPALFLSRRGVGRPAAATLVAHPEGTRALYDEAAGRLSPLVEALLRQGGAVLLIDAFLTGRSVAPASRKAELSEIRYPATYNITDTGHRVQDILTALQFLRSRPEVSQTRLVGIGTAGVWGLLACALDGRVEAAALDLDAFDPGDDARFLADLNVPCLRRAGDLRAAAVLAAPARLLLHRAHPAFPVERVSAAYQAAGAPDHLRVSREVAPDSQVLAWLGQGR
ncbi:MAG: acetylxylan esterase [Armatimonadetes bacterium]|nr:acetylxylan esterase [Armatimonadota bacterium]